MESGIPWQRMGFLKIHKHGMEYGQNAAQTGIPHG
jgi:hypothetical protein